MQKLILTSGVLLFLNLIQATAQNVAINNSGAPADASAMLDVSATSKGLLIPKLALASTATAAPVTTPATGLLVWNINASTAGGNGIGFYFWDGIKWQSLLADNSGWRLQGNSATNPSLHFIGTTDGQPLMFKVNNTPAGRIDHMLHNVFLGLGTGVSNTASYNTFVGDSSGYSNSSGASNSFFGFRAGRKITNAASNSIFGSQAGMSNISGAYNSFFGHNSGRDNTSTGNSFFGDNSGLNNVSGGNNSFFGRSSGSSNIDGDYNSFFGSSSGDFGTTGSSNSFYGYLSGSTNSGDKNNFYGSRAGLFNDGGSYNCFLGNYTGRGNSSGNFNVFLGDSSGSLNSTGSFNTLIGARATTGNNALNNAIAIGYLSQVDANNSMVLGSINGINGATANVKVGIGTTAPLNRLHIVNNNAADGGWAEGLLLENTSPLATVGEAGISFRNTALAENKQWTVGLNQNQLFAFSYGISFAGSSTRMAIDTFGNVGIGTLTPTATLDIDGTSKLGTNGSILTEIIKVTLVKDIVPIAANGVSTETFAVANAQVGSSVLISPGNALVSGLVIGYARVSAIGTVEVKFTNTTGAVIDPANNSFYITVIK